MTQDIGGSIGQRIAQLAFHAATRSSSIGLGIVTRVDMEKIKVDVKLKSKKGTNIVEFFSCPIISQSYQGGGQINIPRVGDLVVILFSKYNVEMQIKNGTLKVNDMDEINVMEQNYAVVIGTLYPIPEDEANEPRSEDSGITESPESTSPPRPPFNRDPIYHDEKVKWSKKFVRERLEPQQDHQIWYHPYDHEIRMTRQEVFIKHKTGTQIIMREPGDLEMYVWRKWNVHARDNIVIESEQIARMLSFVPPKERPFRV